MEIIGFAAGILSLIGYLPQTLKTIRTRRTKDLSLPTFLTVAISAILWVVYGFAHNAPAIWLTNSVVAVCGVIITIIKLRQR